MNVSKNHIGEYQVGLASSDENVWEKSYPKKLQWQLAFLYGSHYSVKHLKVRLWLFQEWCCFLNEFEIYTSKMEMHASKRNTIYCLYYWAATKKTLIWAMKFWVLFCSLV